MTRHLLVFFWALWLAGCGQKGPLVLPSQDGAGSSVMPPTPLAPTPPAKKAGPPPAPKLSPEDESLLAPGAKPPVVDPKAGNVSPPDIQPLTNP